MIITHGHYSPIGPLSYLHVSDSGELLIGIFESTRDKQLAFLFRHLNEYLVIKASETQMEAVMRNKLNPAELISSLPLESVTDVLDNPISSPGQKQLVSEFLYRKLNEKGPFAIHLNYYYTYRQFIWEKKNTETIQ